MAFGTATLTGTYKTFDDQPASGVVEIIPNSRSLVDAEGDVILAGRVKVTLDETGSFTVTLPATDDATVEPAAGRQYTVVAKLRHTHLPAVTGVELATGTTLDVADVASVPETDALVTPAATAAQLDALEATLTTALAGKQPAGDYATTAALTTGLAGKADTAAIPTAPEDVGAEPAGLSAATEAALSATLGKSQRGLYVPGGWGDQWKAAKAAAVAGTGTATVAVMGDSIADGFHFPSSYSASWWGLLRSDLHALRNGGSGFVGVERSALFQGGVPNFATQYASSAADIPVAAGTWTLSGSPDGAGSVQVYSNVNGDTFTFTGEGTRVEVVYNRFGGAGLGGTFSVTIDGNVVGTLTSDSDGAPGIFKETYAVADGPHTVVLTVTGGAYAAINGVRFSRASGFICDNYARAGAASITYSGEASSHPSYSPAPWSGGPNMPADLFIFALGVNDANGVIPPADFRTRIRMIIDQVRVQTPADVLIVANHVGNWQSLPGYYTDYVATMREMCDVYGAAMVNLWALGHNRWADWNDQGFWGDANNVGATGTDGVHPSDLGHAYMHSVIAPLILAD